MISIAICDDDSNNVDIVKQYVETYGVENNLNIEINEYYYGEELLATNKKFDLIFLDIEMKVLNGIETASKIRNLNMQITIIYITSHTKYWKEAYRVHAFDYLIKPVSYDNICSVLNDYFKSIKENNKEQICLICKDKTIMQETNEIYYFLIKDKKIVEANTLYNTYIVNENLSDIYRRLNKINFYMPHRSCILNLQYVQSISKDFDIILKNGEWLPLAQKKKKEFMLKLHEFFRI